MMSSSGEDVFEVEKIIGKRVQGKENEYLVRWKGYSSKHDSWEPASNLAGCKDIIRKYNELPKRLSERTRKPPPSKDVYSRTFNRTIRHSSSSSSIETRNRPSRFRRSHLARTERLSEKTGLRSLSVGIRKRPSKFISLKLSPRRNASIKQDAASFVRISNSSVDQRSGNESANTSSTRSLNSSRASQKVFTITKNTTNVKQWLSLRSPKKTTSYDDHDYVYRAAAAYNRIIPKEPLNFQAPSGNEQSVTTANRKSTLRKGRVFQERLVLLQWRQNYVEIIFANTTRKNALTSRFLKELSNALDAVVASKCSVVVVNTVGSTFCSGMDVHFLVESLTSSKNVSDTAKRLAESLRNFVDKLIEFQRLLIAVVQGPAINLGCAMLSLFDIVYCSDKAYFWTPYVEMGQTPECCSSLLLPEILGPVTANNMLLNGAKLTAAEAKLRGFVTEVFPHDSLKRNATALIENCAKKSSEAIQISKSLIRNANIHRWKQVNFYECSELAERWSSQEFLERSIKFIDSGQI